MAKSPEEMAEAMIANLKEKTGKTLPQWIRIAQRSGFSKHGELVRYLKSDHEITHGYATLIAHKTLQSDAGSAASTDDLVEDQFGGARSNLRPIYDALIAAVRKFGNDVEISPKKKYVSLRRRKQFGLIQPSTSTRVDVGIILWNKEPTERLEKSGSFSAMVSHRVRVTEKSQVDKELIGWLKEAYGKA